MRFDWLSQHLAGSNDRQNRYSSRMFLNLDQIEDKKNQNNLVFLKLTENYRKS